MRIFFISFLLLGPIFVFSQKTIAEQKKNVSSPFYEFKGDCRAMNQERPELLCLPTSPITFDDLFSSKYLDVKIQDINEWFEKNPYFGAKKVEARKNENSVGIFLKESMDALTVLYRFNEFDMISPFSLTEKLQNSTKSEELSKLPPIHWEEIGDLELVFSLLLHLYWNKLSEYRPLMRFFPERIEVPSFTLTPYEFELLKGDDSYEKALALRKGYRESFKNFTRIINKHWTEEQREVFFRNYNPIEEDFMYAIMLVTKYGWIEKEYEAMMRKPHAFIPMGLFLFGSKSEEDRLSYRRSIEEKDDKTKYIDRVIMATHNISKDDQLFLKAGIMENEIQNDPNDVYLLMRNFIPEDNTKDCVNLYIMEESTATSWGIPSVACFNLVNKRIIVFHAVGNLMNMNDDQYQACKRIIDKRETRVMGYEDEKVKVFLKCVHPPWKKFDIWERPLIELDEKTQMYEAKVKKVKKYIKARKQYHLPTNNGEIMRKLFEKRLELCKQLRKEIIKIMDSPKSFMFKDEL